MLRQQQTGVYCKARSRDCKSYTWLAWAPPQGSPQLFISWHRRDASDPKRGQALVLALHGLDGGFPRGVSASSDRVKASWNASLSDRPLSAYAARVELAQIVELA